MAIIIVASIERLLKHECEWLFTIPVWLKLQGDVAKKSKHDVCWSPEHAKYQRSMIEETLCPPDKQAAGAEAHA